MKEKLLFLLCFVVRSVSLFAADDAGVLWRHANKLYQSKQYDSAAATYEKLAAERPANSLLYYNLGNAYFRLNKVGRAVLNYERALQLNPDNKQVKDNLTLAKYRMSSQVRQVDDVFFVQWWDRSTHPAYATAWASLVFFIFLLFVASLLARIMAQGKIMVPVQVSVLLAILWILGLAPAYFSARKNLQSDKAVVMENDTPLQAAEAKGKPLSLLPEGTTVKIRQVKDGQAEVVIPDGRTGWVSMRLMERV